MNNNIEIIFMFSLKSGPHQKLHTYILYVHIFNIYSHTSIKDQTPNQRASTALSRQCDTVLTGLGFVSNLWAVYCLEFSSIFPQSLVFYWLIVYGIRLWVRQFQLPKVLIRGHARAQVTPLLCLSMKMYINVFVGLCKIRLRTSAVFRITKTFH